MKTIHFPYIALALCSFLLLLVIKGSELDSDGSTLIPLLTLLVVSEFSFFVTAIGVYIGAKNINTMGVKSVYTASTALCLLLCITFMVLGTQLWPL